jgi:hypothetical protein
VTGDGAEVRLDGEHGILGAVRRHPLGTFYLLAFLISWGYWVPNAVSGGDLTHAPGLMGPMIAALVITGLTGGRAGLRDLAARMTRWRVPVRWYVAAVAPLAVAVGVTATLEPGRDPLLTGKDHEQRQLGRGASHREHDRQVQRQNRRAGADRLRSPRRLPP